MLLPPNLKGWLEERQWYTRLRYSKPVIQCWLLLRPGVKKELVKQKNLYLPLLRSLNSASKIVFDIGAHEGFLSGIFAAAGYRVIAVEPGKRNAMILENRFKGNRRVTVLNAAASDVSGEIKFYEPDREHAFGTISEKWMNQQAQHAPAIIYNAEPLVVTSFTLDDLIAQYGQPAFIKIDVEGHEEFVLRGLSLQVALISFEAILPGFIRETENCIQRLTRLNKNAVFNFAVDNELQETEFFSGEKLVRKLSQMPPKTIEIFCKT